MSAPDCSLLRARRQRRRLEQRAPPTSAPGHWAAGRCTSQQRLIVGRRFGGINYRDEVHAMDQMIAN